MMIRLPTAPRIRNLVLALVTLTALLPFAVMVWIAAEWRHHEIVDARANATQLVTRAVALHDRELRDCERSVRALAPLLRALPQRQDQVKALLASVLRDGSPQENLWVFAPDGRLLARARDVAPAGTDLAARPFFVRAVQSGHVALDEYHLDFGARSAAVALAHPLTDGSGRVDAVVVRLLVLASLQELLGGTALLPPGTTIHIFDQSGKMVGQPPPQRSDISPQARQKLIAHAIRSGAEGAIDGRDLGAPVTFAFAPLKGSDLESTLFVGFETPHAAATAQTDRALRRLFLLFGFALTTVMLLTWVAADRLLVRHVEALVAGATRLGRGEMDVRVNAEQRPLELAELAETFNRMAEAVQAREREILRQQDVVATQERRIRSILENSTEGVAVRDASGKLLYVSPSGARILGAAPDTAVNQDVRQLIHPDDVPRMQAVHQTVLAQPGVVHSVTCRVRHGDGSWRWISSEVRNLLHDPAVGGVLSNFRDVTETVDAHEELRRAHGQLEERVRERTEELVKANAALLAQVTERKRAQETLQKLSKAMEQTADSVFVTDRNGVIEYVNPAFEEMTGFSRAEAIGCTPRIVSSGRHDRQFFENLWSTISSGHVFRAVTTNKTKDGRLFYEDQTITPVRDEHGTVTHFVSTGRDITERKRTEEALRRLNQMLEGETTRIAALLHDEAGQFLTSAHIMLADVARDVPPAVRARLEEVRQHLDQVEQQLRVISRDLHPRILHDLGLVGSIKFRADAFARRNGIRTEVKFEGVESLSPAVETVVYRVVQEALTNVGRHARATSVTITLTSNGSRLRCAVEDDGIGFDAASTAEDTPLSLGLQGMRDRVEALGGTFEIISSPGRGTLLQSDLPLES